MCLIQLWNTILEIKHLCKTHLACKYVIKQGKLQKREKRRGGGGEAAYIYSTYSRRSEVSVLNTVWNMSAVGWTDSRHLQAVPWWNTALLTCTGVWFLFLFTRNGTKEKDRNLCLHCESQGNVPWSSREAGKLAVALGHSGKVGGAIWREGAER